MEESFFWVIGLVAVVGWLCWNFGRSKERVERDWDESMKEIQRKYPVDPERQAQAQRKLQEQVLEQAKQVGELWEKRNQEPKEKRNQEPKEKRNQGRIPIDRLEQLRLSRTHPELFPGGVSFETMARDDWAMLRAWRAERGIDEQGG